MGSFQKFCLRWNNHSSNFVGNLGLLLASEEYSDVTICCQGEVWHLHQLVLSASSSHFAQLLRLTPPGQTPILILDGPPASDVHALIHFIYHGEVNVDQDSLPSLLRTAASLRIKGLADVSGLTQELPAEASSYPSEGEITTAIAGLTTCGLLPTNNGFEEMCPLNLSCNKSHNFKEEEDSNEEHQDEAKHHHVISSSNPDLELKGSLRKEASDVFFHPPSKRVRTQEPPPAPIGVGPPLAVAVISPSDSQTTVADSMYTPVSNTYFKCKIMSSKPIETVITPNVDLCTQTDPVPKKMLTVHKKQQQQQPVDKLQVLPSKGSATTFYNVPLNASFPMLNMATSPHIAYQKSSTPQPNLEVIRSDHPNSPVEISAAPVSSVCDLSQTSGVYEHKPARITNLDATLSHHEQSRLQSIRDVTTSVATYNAPPNLSSNSVEICSSNVNEHQEKLKVEEKGFNSSLLQLPTDIDESSPVDHLPEKTFNHKKFSPCTIPNSTPSKKTVHVVRGVYTPHPLPTTRYKMKKEVINEPVPLTNEASVNYNPEILIQSQSVVKLTPVAVTSYTSNINGMFPTNSILFTGSSESSFQSSETVLPPTTSANICVQTNPPPNVPVTVVEEKQQQQQKQPAFIQSNPIPAPPPPETAAESAPEISCSSSASSHPPTSSVVVTTTEGTAQSSQRVTINMRTFKEEWRRQLLVDYDPRTNMSICMLCFTTFKSYDGPRKNTYVKHAKRFHPALEDYSDEERGVIIGMYEKYHKYDIDMQKEINKSFRTTNNSGSSLKQRVKMSDSTGLPIPLLSSTPLHSSRVETEGESSEERADSAPESKSPETASFWPSHEPGTGTGIENVGAHSSDKEDVQDIEIPNNNNNNNKNNKNNNNNELNENNPKRKAELRTRGGGAPITS